MAPAGTATEKYCVEPALPDKLLCSRGVDVLPPELRLNWALTVVFALTVNEHEPVPVQVSPLHPVNVLPLAGVAVRVTIEPGGSDSVHVLPQLRAPPDLTTVPLPVPTLAMERTPCGVGTKLAMTFFATFIVMEHGPFPVQSPLHPEKV